MQASLRSTHSLTDTSQISFPLALSNTSNFLTGEEKLVPQPLLMVRASSQAGHTLVLVTLGLISLH